MSGRAILVSCGSFNPPTIAHLRMMEVARDYLQTLPSPLTVIEGVYSPTSSSYAFKTQLASDEHRIEMLKRATDSSSWTRVDDWEAKRGRWSRTREVLLHHREEARRRHNDDSVQCFFVCGGDLVDTFNRVLEDGSRVWALNDVKEIVEEIGLVVVNREGSIPLDTLSNLAFDSKFFHIAEEEICPNDVSSTRLRKAIAEGKSIKYCTPDSVIEYIEEHGLYLEPKSNGIH